MPPLFHRMSQPQKAVERARKAFRTGRTKPLEYRITQLKNLQRLFVERQKEIADALKKDLKKVSIRSPLIGIPPLRCYLANSQKIAFYSIESKFDYSKMSFITYKASLP